MKNDIVDAAQDAKKVVEKKAGEAADYAVEVKDAAVEKASELKDSAVDAAQDAKKTV